MASTHSNDALPHSVEADLHAETAVPAEHGSGGLPQFQFEHWAGQIAWLLILFVALRINQRMHREIARSAVLQEELRERETHYRNLVENLSAIAWEATTGDFTYTYVSAHAETLLGYPLNDWKQPDFWQRCVYPADQARALAGQWHAAHFPTVRLPVRTGDDGHRLPMMHASGQACSQVAPGAAP